MGSSKNCCPFVTKLCAVTKLGDLTVQFFVNNNGNKVTFLGRSFYFFYFYFFFDFGGGKGQCKVGGGGDHSHLKGLSYEKDFENVDEN